MTKQKYIQKYWGAAQAACSGTPIFPLMALAESAVESAWGESFLTREANNFFGTKSTKSWEEAGGKYILKPTREVVKGKNIVVRARFRSYESARQSFENYVHFVTQPGYLAHGVGKAATPEEQIKCIAASGYATDPAYADTVISVMRSLSPALPKGEGEVE